MYAKIGLAASIGLLMLANSMAEPSEYVVPLFDRPPEIDGRIGADEWRGAASFQGFVCFGGPAPGRMESRRAAGWVGADEENIYVAVRSQLPDEGALTAKVKSDTLDAVYDDAVEVFVCPSPDSRDRVDYQLLQNSLGKGGYNIHRLGSPDEEGSWTGGWKSRHSQQDGFWDFECAIPVSSMRTAGAGRKTTDGVWTINLCRDWKPDWGWSSISGGYANKGLRFVFRKAPLPVAQVSFEGTVQFPPANISLGAFNPSDREMAAEATISIVRNNMPEIKAGGRITLPPKGTVPVSVALDANDPTTIYEMKMTLRDASGAPVYSRDLSWIRAKSKPLWLAEKPKDAPIVDFNFAYYPSRNILRIAIDLNGLPKDARPEKAIVSVRQRSGGAQVAGLEVPASSFKDGRAEIRMELPVLEGLYEIAVRAVGESVPEGAVTVKPFRRERFPWEGSPLGRSKKVYPPFEPIRAEGRKISTVLKSHEYNDFGLLDQAAATSANTGVSKPVLSRPMRYVARASGRDIALQAGPSRIAKAEDHEVVAEGSFSGGPIKAFWKNTWDIDGTVRVDLTLEPTREPVEELSLEIPFDSASTTLMHSNSDRIRAPVAQKIPEGRGVVWDSSKLACDNYIRNFCPYIYLGSAVRGLCFFADNDRDWGWNPETPSVQVIREGDEVILRIRLINVAARIDRRRTMTFGLLAAPVKPPLNPKDREPDWWRYRYLRGNYRLLGTDINWFGNHSCGTVYPAGCDLFLWQILAKGSRVRLTDQEISRTVQHGLRYFEPYGREAVETWKAHVESNLRRHLGGNMIFYYNRGVCQELPEVETFKDEWCIEDYRSFGEGSGRAEIKIVPTESYEDYALYWYSLSFDIGNNQGVYWDNWFICPTYNTETGGAYRRADGAIVPSAGIWALRNLCRRTFIMENERGMLPITFPHMTSFSPLPMLSFATVQYDWEWKYSEGDVQERHSREYILLASTGELAGVWPVPLQDHGEKALDLWEQRTFSAVRLVHELDGYGGWGFPSEKSHAENARRLAAPVIGMLGEKGLKVYKYWEDRPIPVSADDPDIPSIVYLIPGRKAVAVFASYSRNDKYVNARLDMGELGFSQNAKAYDAETGEEMEIRDSSVKFRLKSHDAKVLRIEEKK